MLPINNKTAAAATGPPLSLPGMARQGTGLNTV
jgi:hypothetical protein